MSRISISIIESKDASNDNGFIDLTEVACWIYGRLLLVCNMKNDDDETLM